MTRFFLRFMTARRFTRLDLFIGGVGIYCFQTNEYWMIFIIALVIGAIISVWAEHLAVGKD